MPSDQQNFKVLPSKGSKMSKRKLLFALLSSSAVIGSILYVNEQNAQNAHLGQALSLFEQELETPEMAQFLRFVAEHGKTYASQTSQMAERYTIFKDNLKQIDEFNADSDGSFEMAVNQFSDLTSEEFMAQQTGIKMPMLKKQPALNSLFMASEASAPEFNVSDLPESVNWVEKGMVSTPYDQGSCGGCWAFATASSLESLATIKGLFDKVPEFSVQQLMDCDNVNFGCDGGWMMDGYQYVLDNGIELKHDYKTKYIKKKSKCHHKNGHKEAFRITGGVEEDEISNDRLKFLLTQQPIAVAMYSSSHLQHYKKGVMTEKYLKCSDTRKEVNHAVVVVGYGKVEEGEKLYGKHATCEEYWIVRNSWGARWGEEGFFRLCMDPQTSKHKQQGICQVNYYTQRPTFDADLLDDILNPQTAESFLQ